MRENQGVSVEGSKVVLVPYAREHVEKYHEWMKDEEIRFLTGSQPLTLHQEYDMQRKWAEDADKCTFIILAKDLVDPSSSKFHLHPAPMVGDVNLFFVEDDEERRKVAEVEVMVAERDWQAKGLGAEAVALIMRYAAEHLHRTHFQAKIGSDNTASRGLFESKFGFRLVSESAAFSEVTLALDWPSEGQKVADFAGPLNIRPLPSSSPFHSPST